MSRLNFVPIGRFGTRSLACLREMRDKSTSTSVVSTAYIRVAVKLAVSSN